TLPLACSFSCNSNTAPSFTGGTTLTVCQNAAATAINNLLTVVEPNLSQTMTWSVTSAPTKGTLNGFNYSTTSTGSNLTPTGLTYTHTSGQSGSDAFTIQISDGIATATKTVNITISAVSGSTTITNVACNGAATGAINLTPSGGTGPYTFNWGG